MTLANSLHVERAVIFHVDDVGMCHGANRGFLDLAERGFVTCGSVMVPCPWFREIAEAAADDPALERAGLPVVDYIRGTLPAAAEAVEPGYRKLL